MKNYLETRMNGYNQPDIIEVIVELFGNHTIRVDAKGYLPGTYYDDMTDELFDFGEPKPITNIRIWSWDELEDYRPFMKLAGCRNVGFKEAAQYFIDCLKISDEINDNIKPKSLKTNANGVIEFSEDADYPDTNDHMKGWKDNIDLITEVLINTPAITDEYSDTDDINTFLSKFDDNEQVKLVDTTTVQQWYFDAQCGRDQYGPPKFIIDEVRQLWRDMELGNDNYVYSTYLDEDLFECYPNIYFWFKFKGAMKDDRVHVHWWW
jgi:hypothetical protein